jgi:hypothetical protein
MACQSHTEGTLFRVESSAEKGGSDSVKEQKKCLPGPIAV